MTGGCLVFDHLAAPETLRKLSQAGFRLVLACATEPGQDLRAELRAAGIEDLFAVVLPSAQLGVSPDSLIFHRLIVAAAGCHPELILYVGHDVRGALAHGIQAACIRPTGLGPGEILPFGVMLIRDVGELVPC
ncbi:HAD family hydrolase [Acrocarpospora catenulata]|uniref:HAD family hydrolase n=1 Tax=Acrocarpospora catenulata TaxID=2836182 RepID=UPI001BDAF4A9|nr:hypothetical protein [Acrocarpospora catenulata]